MDKDGRTVTFEAETRPVHGAVITLIYDDAGGDSI